MASYDRVVQTLAAALGEPFPAPPPEARFLCPRCHKRGKKQDTAGHLHVNTEKEKFNCFRCEWKGPLKYLLESVGLRLDSSIRDWYAVATGVSLFTGKTTKEEPYDNTIEIPYPCDIIHPLMFPEAWSYLTDPKTEGGRGLTLDQINMYRIVASYDVKYSGRVFIPTITNGKVVYWVARTMTGQEPKYLNPKGIDKSYYLFNFEQAKQFDSVVITEGVFSAIAAGPNAVCGFGKAFSTQQLTMLLDANFKKYVIALDGDARKQAIAMCKWFVSRGRTETYLVDIPDGEDPDSDADFPSRLLAAKKFSFYSTIEYGLLD